VWREMMGDLETPVAAFAKLVGEGSGFLLESVEHGGQWGRFSFVGRDPSAVVVAKRDSTGKATLTATGVLPEGIRLDEGVLAALEDILRAYDAPQHPRS
jgi:anthranilate synthase component I